MDIPMAYLAIHQILTDFETLCLIQPPLAEAQPPPFRKSHQHTIHHHGTG